MDFLDWLLGNDSWTVMRPTQWVGEAVQRVVRLNPRLRLARHYRARLKPARMQHAVLKQENFRSA